LNRRLLRGRLLNWRPFRVLPDPLGLRLMPGWLSRRRGRWRLRRRRLRRLVWRRNCRLARDSRCLPAQLLGARGLLHELRGRELLGCVLLRRELLLRSLLRRELRVLSELLRRRLLPYRLAARTLTTRHLTARHRLARRHRPGRRRPLSTRRLPNRLPLRLRPHLLPTRRLPGRWRLPHGLSPRLRPHLLPTRRLLPMLPTGRWLPHRLPLRLRPHLLPTRRLLPMLPADRRLPDRLPLRLRPHLLAATWPVLPIRRLPYLSDLWLRLRRLRPRLNARIGRRPRLPPRQRRRYLGSRPSISLAPNIALHSRLGLSSRRLSRNPGLRMPSRLSRPRMRPRSVPLRQHRLNGLDRSKWRHPFVGLGGRIALIRTRIALVEGLAVLDVLVLARLTPTPACPGHT